MPEIRLIVSTPYGVQPIIQAYLTLPSSHLACPVSFDTSRGSALPLLAVNRICVPLSVRHFAVLTLKLSPLDLLVIFMTHPFHAGHLAGISPARLIEPGYA